MQPVIWMDTQGYAEGRASLEQWARLVAPEDFPGQTWQASLQQAQAAVATARFVFDAAVLSAAPRLKIIARLGVGYDNVDVEAASTLGICVTITPDGSSQSVAEHTLALMLALARQLPLADRSVRTGDWDRRRRLLGPELSSLTLGVVGLGRIGGRVARMAGQGFGMRVLVYDPYRSEAEIRSNQAEPRPSLVELLAQADVVSLHVPGNAETYHMLSAETLAQMKPGAWLINTARGPVVDESALVAALQSGQVGAAGMDVFEHEPPDPSGPLAVLPNVILSPHSAGLSADSTRRIGLQAAGQVYAVLHDILPEHMLNPHVWEKRRRSTDG